MSRTETYLSFPRPPRSFRRRFENQIVARLYYASDLGLIREAEIRTFFDELLLELRAMPTKQIVPEEIARRMEEETS